MMDYVLLSGYRKNSKLIYIRDEKMLFRKTRTRNQQSEYVCYQDVLSEKEPEIHPKCNARLKLNQTTYIRNKTAHSKHDNHKKKFQELKLVNKIKEACKKSGANLASHKVSTKEIFIRELARFQSKYKYRPSLEYNKAKRQLFRIKNKKYPPLPKTVADIKKTLDSPEVCKDFRLTLEKSHVLYVGSVVTDSYSFVVFASYKIIELISRFISSEERKYLVDGTFKIVPHAFYQLLVISIEYKNDVFPVSYVLTTKKSALSYRSIFNFIEHNVFQLKPKEIITDFEAGLRKALNEVYPNALLRGCWFHFCLNITKKCNELGLRSLIRKNPEAKFHEKAIMNLPLLPSDDTLYGFGHIKTLVRESDLSNQLEPLLSYVENYWLRKQNTKNPISVADLNMRTTSSLESLNSQLGRSFPTRGHIWKFIEQLKYHEFSKAYDMLKLTSEYSPTNISERKRKKDVQRQRKIEFFTSLLKEGNIDAGAFLEAMGNKIILPANKKEAHSQKTNYRIGISKQSKPIKKTRLVKK